MSRRLADVLRGPLVPVVVVGMAAALDTHPPPPLLTVAQHRCHLVRPALEGGEKAQDSSSVSRDQTTEGSPRSS